MVEDGRGRLRHSDLGRDDDGVEGICHANPLDASTLDLADRIRHERDRATFAQRLDDSECVGVELAVLLHAGGEGCGQRRGVGIELCLGHEALEAEPADVVRAAHAGFDVVPQLSIDHRVDGEDLVDRELVTDLDDVVGRHRRRERQRLGRIRVEEGVIEVEEPAPVRHGGPVLPFGGADFRCAPPSDLGCRRDRRRDDGLGARRGEAGPRPR